MNLQAALTATIFGEPAQTASDIARWFDPGYTQVTDGVTSGYDDFVAHIAHVRTIVASGRIVVHEQAEQGDVIADRHTVTVTKHDGTSSSLEVLLIGRLAPDGRLASVVETTRLLSGADADLGRAT